MKDNQHFDFHTHLLIKKMMNPTLLNFLSQINPGYYARMDEFSDNPGLFAEYLKSQGLKYAVVLSEVAPATSGLVRPEDVTEFCKGQDMLLPFVSINPLFHPDPAERLEFYVKDCGAKGLKFMPSYQFFYPNDASLYPIYSKAQELGIPVMFHIGSSVFKGTKMKYCDPIYLDDIAVDFPDLKIVMAHSGRGFWYEKCFFLSRVHKNVYMEITGLPPDKLLTYFPDLDKNGEKVLFGSDWPALQVDISKNIEAIKSLPLSERTIEAMLYGNAYKILFE
ncbi:MAG: amidohydrolase [Deltaproteobacteria bacterium]|nr:amidohydrolase [Deltaproteobacteria bacterium]